MEGDRTDLALLNLALLIESSPHLAGWHDLTLPNVIEHLLQRNWTISALHNNTSRDITYTTVKQIATALKKAPGDDIRTTGATVTYVILTGFAAVAVWLRLYSRRTVLKKTNFKPEDWVIWIALLLSIGLATCMVYGDYRVGFGSHIYLLSWNMYKSSLLMVYISEVIYLTCLAIARTAVLMVLLNLSSDIRFRLGAYTIGFFNITIFIVRICFVILQCKPIDQWNYPLSKTCVGDESTYQIALGCLNVALNASLLFLPTTIMHGFKLPKKDKLMTLGIFFLGFVGCGASIVRIFAVMWYTDATDRTFHQPPFGIWSVVEVNLGIACACAPSLRAIILSRTDKNFQRRRSLWGRRPPPVLTHGHLTTPYRHREIVTHRVDSALSNRSSSRNESRNESRSESRNERREQQKAINMAREKGMDSRNTGRSTERASTFVVSPKSPCSSPYSPARDSPKIHVHGPQGEIITIDDHGNSHDNSGVSTPTTTSSGGSGGSMNNHNNNSSNNNSDHIYMYGNYSRNTTNTRSQSRSSSGSGSKPTSRDASSSRDRSWSREVVQRHGSNGSGNNGGGGGLRVQQPMENRVTVSADTIAQMIEEEEEEERQREESHKVGLDGRSWLQV